MAIETEDGLSTPDLNDGFNYVPQMATLATTTQQALEKRANTRIGTSAQRNASIDLVQEGTLWVDTNGSRSIYTKQGNNWELVWPIPRIPTARNFLKSQSGWTTTPDSNNYIKGIGDWVYICWFFQRSGGTINVPSSGDIVNQTVAIVHEKWRPNTWQPLSSAESGRAASIALGSNGHIRLNAVGGTANINKGSKFSVRGWYHLTI